MDANRKPWIAAAAVLSMAFASPAFAHAFLDHASPRVGSVVERAPGAVELWFTQELEGAFSTLRVMDANGREVDRKDKRLDPSDRTAMRVSIPALPAGKYRVV